MASIGRTSRLFVVRLATPGAFLDGGELGEILLPGRYVPRGTITGESFEVFVHRDSEDRVVATTERPMAEVGQCAALRVVSSDPHRGAFLDWGLSKDLLLPVREQDRPVEVGERVVVVVLVDARSDRIIASCRLARHLGTAPPPFVENQAVSLLVVGPTPLGYTAVVDGTHLGLLYRNEVPGDLAPGQALDGYVRAVREDGKIDLSLNASGYRRVLPLKETILEALAKAGGTLPHGDRSDPEAIRAAFGCSKKAFKQAIGALYRERLILIGEDAIRSVPPGARR